MSKRVQNFQPISSLIVYSSGNEYYVEQSDIINNRATGYKPIDEVFIGAIAENLNKQIDKIEFSGYVPENVVAYCARKRYNELVWRTEPQQQILIMNTNGFDTAKRIVPGLVWHITDTLDLYAYKEWKGIATLLYRAPFFNITNESVCLGTASDYLQSKTTKYSFSGLMKAVEDTFWNSAFTHGGSDTDQINGSFADLFQITKTAETYPYSFLVSSDKTIKDIIDAFEDS